MKLLMILGLILFFGSIGLIISNIDTLEVERYGKVVPMRIEKLPVSCIGAKVSYFVTYSYHGLLFDKATRGNYCEQHKVGEFIEMKYLPGSTIILRPGESATLNMLSSCALGILGLTISLMQWRKLRLQMKNRKSR